MNVNSAYKEKTIDMYVYKVWVALSKFSPGLALDKNNVLVSFSCRRSDPKVSLGNHSAIPGFGLVWFCLSTPWIMMVHIRHKRTLAKWRKYGLVWFSLVCYDSVGFGFGLGFVYSQSDILVWFGKTIFGML